MMLPLDLGPGYFSALMWIVMVAVAFQVGRRIGAKEERERQARHKDTEPRSQFPPQTKP